MSGPLALDLYLVTDRRMCAGRGVEQVVAEAVRGGATMVQLRDDETAAAELIALAVRLVGMLRPLAVPLIVNNRIDVAAAAGADGVHLGQADAAPAAARARLGPHALIGWSVTAPEQVAAQVPAEVDYLGVGPVFATATKADAAPPTGIAGLAAVRARTALPIVAIGGLDRANAPAVIAAGADGIAVVSALCASADPTAAARELARVVADAKERMRA
jgi:thiamine-phosphate pyrophosphorylase